MGRIDSSPRVGLVLSGGGVRGLAHIGVLKVLERERIPIQLVAGTSIGGLIGALYASGMSAAEIEQEALKLADPRRLLSLIDRALPRRGLLQGQRVIEYLEQLLGQVTFEELALPFAMVAVDINTAEKVILREGRVLDGIRATIAIPGVFAPVKRGEHLLVDGGLLDNLPTDVARQMGAEVVVAVDISTDEKVVDFFVSEMQRNRLVPRALADLLEVIWRSTMVVAKEIHRHNLQESPPDVLIMPPVPPEVTTISGFDHADEAIAAGEQAAMDALPQLRRLLRKREGFFSRAGRLLGNLVRD